MRLQIASVCALSIIGIVAASACGDDETTNPATTSTTTTSSTGGMGGGGTGPGGGGTGPGGMGGGGSGMATAEVLIEFDAMMGQQSEGLALTADSALVGFLPIGEIGEVDLATSMLTDWGSTAPFPMPGAGYLLGLAIDSNDNVYGGLASFSPAVLGGVYQWPAAGGVQATPWATDNAFFFPNGLAFDSNDILYVADSIGTIFEVNQQGNVQEWLSDPLLVGDMANCANAPTPLDIGANGIAITATDMYVANTNFGTIVRVPIEANGAAGVPEVLAGPDCTTLGGADGVWLDGTTLYVAVNAANAIVSVDVADGTVTPIFSGAPLQSPASIVKGSDGALYVTNAAFGMMQVPGLVKITLP
jgi:hypothetical protein